MKVLLDACVWGGSGVVLTTAGHEVEIVAAWPRDPGDKEILSHAFETSQVIVTIDTETLASLRLCTDSLITASSVWWD